ncbi:DUF885 domain-containing protein [Parahaliea mediterranea]|uniref:DUF885 domain-containing protein n=1 Tax=Parahaliea mediterranea TaxID=651086 RepID=UPI0013004E95|nr:DUF885 domain-containing protein [Parahaliea mediterranea]
MIFNRTMVWRSQFSCLLLLLLLPLSALSTEAQKLDDMLDAVYERRVQSDPILATKLGRRSGMDAWPDLSAEAYERGVAEVRADLTRLHRDIDAEQLDSTAQLNYSAFEADLNLRLERDRWRYHINPINQIVGLHLEITGVLVNYHTVDDVAAAEAYIHRLASVGEPVDQLIAALKVREARGFQLPAALFPRLIQSAQSIASGVGDDNVILSDFQRKLQKLALPEAQHQALLQGARAAFDGAFAPAYARLVAELQAEQARARGNDGVWRMPDGDAFYRFLLRQYTTTDISPDEVHALGLAEVERLHREMDAIREQVGFDGNLKDFLAHLKTDPQFYFDNSSEGRSAYLALAQQLVDGAVARVGEVIPGELPAPLRVKRIEAYREKSAPVGFYEAGNVAEGKLGTVYLGMYDMAGAARYDLPALLFHEGVPGHHLQAAVMQTEPAIPAIRQYYTWWQNTAYTEGWALYAESLANDMGLYQDPYAQFGRLAGELWRACRLVVDSGLHARRWSREKAIAYLNDNTASSVENNERAVDRYLAVPGQATAFRIGMGKLLELRERAAAGLGEQFDSRDYHALVLRSGPVPLHLLEQQIDRWIATASRQ